MNQPPRQLGLSLHTTPPCAKLARRTSWHRATSGAPARSSHLQPGSFQDGAPPSSCKPAVNSSTLDTGNTVGDLQRAVIRCPRACVHGKPQSRHLPTCAQAPCACAARGNKTCARDGRAGRGTPSPASDQTLARQGLMLAASCPRLMQRRNFILGRFSHIFRRSSNSLLRFGHVWSSQAVRAATSTRYPLTVRVLPAAVRTQTDCRASFPLDARSGARVRRS